MCCCWAARPPARLSACYLTPTHLSAKPPILRHVLASHRTTTSSNGDPQRMRAAAPAGPERFPFVLVFDRPVPRHQTEPHQSSEVSFWASLPLSDAGAPQDPMWRHGHYPQLAVFDMEERGVCVASRGGWRASPGVRGPRCEESPARDLTRARFARGQDWGGRFEPVQRSIDGKLEARSVLSSGPDQQ